jgi:predicted phosphodiesterase
VRLGIVSDSHLCPTGTPPAAWHNPYDFEGAEARLDLAVRFLRGQDVDAVAMLGDLTNFGDEASIARAVAVLAAAGVPVFVVPGNHDCERGVADFRAHVDRLGAPAVAIAGGGRDVSGLHVVGLTDLAFDVDDDTLLIADVESHEWGDAPVVVLTHFPLLDRGDAIVAAGFKIAGGYDDRGVARRLLARPAPAIVLHGHLHVRDAAIEGNVLQISCAALIEPPYEASVVTIERHDGRFRVQVEHTALVASDLRLPVLTPDRGSWTYDGAGWTPAVAS